MAIPDFTVKTPSIDPMAIANILQRRGQIEQEQRNHDQKRKDDQINNIMEAVKTGQMVASNMMALAEKRNQAKGLKDLTSLVASPEPTAPAPTANTTMGTVPVQPSPEDTAAYQQKVNQRQKDFLSALIRSNPDDVTKELVKSKFSKGEQYAPQQASIELKNGKIIPAPFINGKYYYPNTQTPIPPEEIVGKGYGLNFTTDAAGNQIALSRSTGSEINRASTSAPGTKEPLKEADNIFVLPAPRRAEFVKTVEATKNDPQFRGEIQKVVNASTFERSLAAENQILDSGAALQFRKVFGDAGNISIVEQQASEGDQQAWEKAKQLVEKKILTGKLDEHNRQIMKDGLKVLRESAHKNLLLQTELQAKSMKAQYPELSERLIAENILGKSIHTNLKKKYPDVSSEFTDSSNSDKQVDDFFNSLLGKK